MWRLSYTEYNKGNLSPAQCGTGIVCTVKQSKSGWWAFQFAKYSKTVC